MKTERYTKNDITVAIVRSDEVFEDTQQAVEVIMSCDCDRMILSGSNFPEAFFDLKTGLAGDILQKCSNYRVTIAIVGDFSKYDSKSLHAFISECNRGNQVFFLPDEDTALARMQHIRK